MLLGQVPRILLRRWYVTLGGLLLAAGFVLAVVDRVGPTYTVTSEVLLMPPSTVVPKGSNPYLQLGGLESIGSVASKAMTDDKSVRDIRTRFGELDYGVGLDQLAAAPMVIIQVEADEPERAQRAETYLSERFVSVVRQLQDEASVPRDSLITTQTIVPADVPKVGHKSQLRMGIVAGALGVMGTLVLAAVADALLNRRRRRRGQAREALELSVDDAHEPRHEAPGPVGPPDPTGVDEPAKAGRERVPR